MSIEVSNGEIDIVVAGGESKPSGLITITIKPKTYWCATCNKSGSGIIFIAEHGYHGITEIEDIEHEQINLLPEPPKT